jgi:hypothetical protein
MTEGRRILAIALLFAIGFGLIALASAAEATWPLLLTPLPYAAIPLIVVRADEPEEPVEDEGAPASA